MAAIKDLYFFNSILNSGDALDYYSGDNYIYILSGDNFYNPFYTKEVAFSYKDYLIDILDNSVDVSSLTNPYLTIYQVTNGYIEIVFHDGSLEYYSNNSASNLLINNCLHYQYNINTGNFVYLNSNNVNLSSNSNKRILLSTYDFYARKNPQYTTLAPFNYMLAQGQCGDGPGGLHILGENCIIINGVTPTDIKLNGATPSKIILNGNVYFERGSI